MAASLCRIASFPAAHLSSSRAFIRNQINERAGDNPERAKTANPEGNASVRLVTIEAKASDILYFESDDAVRRGVNPAASAVPVGADPGAGLHGLVLLPAVRAAAGRSGEPGAACQLGGPPERGAGRKAAQDQSPGHALPLN